MMEYNYMQYNNLFHTLMEITMINRLFLIALLSGMLAATEAAMTFPNQPTTGTVTFPTPSEGSTIPVSAPPAPIITVAQDNVTTHIPLASTPVEPKNHP